MEYPKMVYLNGNREIYEIADNEEELKMLESKGFGDLGTAPKKAEVEIKEDDLDVLPITNRYKNILRGLKLSSQDLEKMTLEELIDLDGIGKAVAEKIYDAYRE